MILVFDICLNLPRNQYVCCCEFILYMQLLVFLLTVLLHFFPSQGLVAGTVVIGTLILVKIFWDYGKSG